MLKKVLLLAFVFAQFPEADAQNMLKLASEVYQAQQELNDAYETVNKVQLIVKDIEAGKTPNIASYGSDWSVLANGYKNAAARLRKAPLVTDFDQSKYALSLAELQNCHLRDQNFGKLRGYNTELQQGLQRGQAELAKLQTSKDLISKTQAALRYLIDVNGKLMGVPVYGQIFQWNWVDLELGVRPALSDLSSAVNEQEKKLKNEMTKVTQQTQNLTSNIALLENSICLVPGTYSGTGNVDGESVTMRLTITGTAGNYRGTITVTIDGETENENLPQITVNQNRYLSFAIDGDTVNAELAQDYKSIINMRSADGAFGIVLVRQ